MALVYVDTDREAEGMWWARTSGEAIPRFLETWLSS